MTREVTTDFNQVIDFIKNYNLTDIESEKDFTDLLKNLHKHYYAYLTLVWGLHYQNAYNTQTDERLIESCSDIAHVLFLMAHGAYKPANLILRSSIENFIKGIGVIQDPTILTEKSVYKIFDSAKNFKLCELDNFTDLCNQLNTHYTHLCSVTHTATYNEMEHLSSLASLPKFDKSKAETLKNISVKILKIYIKILVFSYRIDFMKMDFRHRDNVMNVLSAELKRKILLPE